MKRRWFVVLLFFSSSFEGASRKPHKIIAPWALQNPLLAILTRFENSKAQMDRIDKHLEVQDWKMNRIESLMRSVGDDCCEMKDLIKKSSPTVDLEKVLGVVKKIERKISHDSLEDEVTVYEGSDDDPPAKRRKLIPVNLIPVDTQILMPSTEEDMNTLLYDYANFLVDEDEASKMAEVQ